MKSRTLFRLLAGAAVGLGSLLWCVGSASAQTAAGARESAVKAAFLYKFPSFVEWPPGALRPQQPLVIAVSGDDEVAADLEQLIASRADDRTVTVRRVADGVPVQGAHVLFLGSRREGRLQELIDSVKGPMLIVTEQPGALQLGSVLNFTSESGRVRFSASLPSAEARGLKLSSRLLAVAQRVEGGAR